MEKAKSRCRKCKYRHNEDYCILFDEYIDFRNQSYCDSFVFDSDCEDEDSGFSIVDLEDYEKNCDKF